jgi:hypothetical protein
LLLNRSRLIEQIRIIKRPGITFFNGSRNVWVFGFLTIIWAPLAFLNFDPHHDGLILSTIRLTKYSITNGGDYPFNQYGAFWTFPFLIISYFVNSEYLFLAMRVLTISFYLLSTYILFKASKFFLQASYAWIPPALFLCAQPFVSDIGSDLVTWPSAVVMPIVLLVFYNSMLVMRGNYSKRILILIGLLLPPILFTRIQIGVLTAIAVGVVLFLSSRFSNVIWVFLGFFVSASSTIVILAKLGWWNSALYDEFVFGLTYLSADKSTFPKPIFTFLGILLTVLFLFLAPRFRKLKLIENQNRKLLILLLVAIFFTVILTVKNRNLDFLQSQVLVTRITWIVIALGSLVFFVLSIGFEALRNPRNTNFPKPWNRENIVLTFFAIALQSQAYPLFDQMHFWWGSPITFLILTMVFQKLLKDLQISEKNRKILSLLLTILLVITILYPWLSQISKDKFEYPNEIGLDIFSSNSAVREQDNLQHFFSSYIPSGSTVLNLCDDTNVFFAADRYLPSSRFFVFWAEQMSHADRIFEDMKNSNPDFIVSCDLTHVPALRATQEVTRDILISSFGERSKLKATYVGMENKHWFIFGIHDLALISR